MAKIDIQAQGQEQKMDAQAHEFHEAVQKGLEFVRDEAQQFAEELCSDVKAELLQEVHDIRSGVQDMKEEVAANTLPHSWMTGAIVQHQYSTRPLHLPPLTPPGHHTGRRKLAEFDGSVAWEAYQAQFQMLADAMDWDEAERYEEKAARPHHDISARRTQMETPSAAKPVGVKRTSVGEFQGSCWGCGERGHMRS
ncbi:hypothetical protein E2C01_049996 [Portunus trituberculatus]|uniref:CCHC-type domain-containing protein n=1 Tax=Portunus trituberculatus TaxID=210409 RepID=A0A5B7GFH0_PORTR|nr:hypothetical protein [Portunus trituberculatus]